jgi:hypothetical protein
MQYLPYPLNHYQPLNQAMRAQEANKAQRADLRGQLFDAVALGATVVAPVSIAVNFEQSIARLGAITRSYPLNHYQPLGLD